MKEEIGAVAGGEKGHKPCWEKEDSSVNEISISYD